MDFDELRGLFIFDKLDDDHLRTLMEGSAEVPFEPGQLLFVQGEPADYWWALLEGRVELVRRAAGREEKVAYVFDTPGQWGGGLRAWTDDRVSYVASLRGASHGRALRVPVAVLRATVQDAQPLGFHLLIAFFSSLRSFEAESREWESLVALGRMSAGLAHELNNPAAAAARSADALQQTSEEMMSSLVDMACEAMSADEFIKLDALRRELSPQGGGTDSVVLADREDAITTWLDAHEVDKSWELAPLLAAAGADIEWLERAREVCPGHLLGTALAWVASALSTQSLIGEVKEATGRISALVADVRSYTQVGRSALQEIDVTEGLESTVSMLGHRLRPGVTVTRNFDSAVPKIEANPAELNQVWTNLIGNAIDAMNGSGTLTLSTRSDGDDVVVDVADSGSGITPEVKARIFDAFFTTKDVGKGTGLGLGIARQIVVERHRGSIDVDSEPGHTVFHVRLPRRQHEAGGNGSATSGSPES